MLRTVIYVSIFRFVSYLPAHGLHYQVDKSSAQESLLFSDCFFVHGP